MYEDVCTHMATRVQPVFSVTLYRIPLTQVLLLNLKLVILTRLASQGMPEIYLSPTHNTEITDMCPAFMWVLGFRTHVFMLQS